MDDFERTFRHYPQHRVLICKQCQYAVVPTQTQRHLREHHNRLSVEQRNEIIANVQSLSDLAHTAAEVVYPTAHSNPLPELPIFYDGLRCTGGIPEPTNCRYLCRTIRRIQEHCKTKHQWANQQSRGGNIRTKQIHTANKLWQCNRACQVFFKFGAWKRYFEVAATSCRVDKSETGEIKASFFRRQEEDMRRTEQDACEAANRVQGFEDHRSSVLPWLRTIGIVDHVRGLKKDQIRAAIALPSNDDDGVLPTILEAMDDILQRAHGWCFDGPECMLTWPYRVVLSRFQSSQVEMLGNTRAFDPYKGPCALKAYFKLAKQFMVYMDRLAGSRDYHFSEGKDEGLHRPEDVMEPNSEQLTTWHRIRHMARDVADGRSDTTDIKDAILKMWILLISHHTGARRHRSPRLSFCAMLSIELSTGSWIQPGNFNSHLSAIIWVVQLLVFYDSAQRELLGDGETLPLVKQFCESNLQQTADTPLGEILRRRLLLYHVSQNSVGTHQATWDEDEEVLRYKGTELRMDHIPTLLVSEYRDCQRYLYDDLMFASKSIRHMYAAMLKDNMDVHTVGWNFCRHRNNEKLLHHSDRTLLSIIEQSPLLCKLFLVERGGEQGGMAWRESALALYEATVQEFLKRLAVLADIEGGPPLREGEFFSIIWKNTQRQRSIYIHLKRVMIHTIYDKSQQQRGQLRDNIRFLSDLVGDLLLDYLIYIIGTL